MPNPSAAVRSLASGAYRGMSAYAGREDTASMWKQHAYVSAGWTREIARYAYTGEPMDKAGAYAIQEIGGIFVSRIEGSPSNVIDSAADRCRPAFESG